MRVPANELAASAARKFVRAVLAERTAPRFPGAPTLSDRSVDDAVLLVSELVTSAVTHSGFELEVACRIEAGPRSSVDSARAETGFVGVVVEVLERAPSGGRDGGKSELSHLRGHGRRLMRTLAESWGVTHRRTERVAWFRLEGAMAPPLAIPEQDVTGPLPESVRRGPPAPALPRDLPARSAEWAERAGQSFLAEAGELLAGQLDEDMVAALAGQLLVPRLADWCGVWLTTDNAEMRLSHVWHMDERRIRALRLALQKDRPSAGLSTTGVPWPWPESGDAGSPGGSALAFPLVAGGRCHGTLLIGQAGLPHLTDAVVRLAEDVARRMAQAVVTARHYTRQESISRSLQRRQLPTSLAAIPGVDTAIVYEPWAEGQTVGGDFYDLFPIEDHRWCFLLGDVSGHDVEAMSVTGLARHLVRLLAREGHGVESLLNRLNLAMAEEAAEAMTLRGEREGSRFLSLLYGELEPDPVAGGARCTLASAGHPPPLRLALDGSVTPAAGPQMLLGIEEHTEYHANSFTLEPGETLLCVTDGVTERRRGTRQLDDDDGLAEVLRGCVGLGAKAVAECVRRAAHDFSNEPIEDDLAVLVLEAVPVLRSAGTVTTAPGGDHPSPSGV
ncbi:SpoIIE family protein phosphatase [Streptomyces spongiae]|uniref:SpoIIE family protein phosphatase n=1 Tax=Streptomyces spongiae TaxID=565072 RepID=A0A5N8XRM6_9ACTN|nr:SpoIIE family protein phosphatase [Streptomyces spongiae]MPY62047.1 SpoIIE family protein phosphatase [Streptomyces spongiae]